MRQAALLALMALTAGLIVILPESADEGYALDSGATELSIVRFDGAAPAAGRYDASPSDGGEELALPAAAGSDGGAGDDAGPAAESMSASLADSAAERSVFASDGAGLAAELAALDATTTAPPSTTEAPTTTAAPTTETAVTQPVTTETSAVETTLAQTAGDGSATSETQTSPPNSEAAANDGANADAAADQADSTPADTATTDPASPETTTTTAPDTDPAVTDPEATSPAPEPEPTPPLSAPADNGWVDAGNGVSVPPVLIAIRYCESRDNYTAANKSSSARGGYQFLTSSWAAYGHKDRYGVNQAHLATPAQQDEAALITWERDGTRPWNASKSCWTKRI